MRLRSAGKNDQDEERIKDPQDAEEAGEVRTIFLKPSFPGGSLVADSLREALNNSMRTRPGWIEPEIYFRIVHAAKSKSPP